MVYGLCRCEVTAMLPNRWQSAFCSMILLAILQLSGAFAPTCDGHRYGIITIQDRHSCFVAASKFPHDKDIRYFVEQQMRTSVQYPKYDAFIDPRAGLVRPRPGKFPRS